MSDSAPPPDFLGEAPNWLDEAVTWRRDLHAHPELAFQETRTADFVAKQLESFGLEVHTGIAGTGVVGVLSTGPGPSMAFRADMDALPITERNDFGHASTRPGVMHACGHDGHTAMLLAAARYLSEAPRFTGTIHFIFQPAEENEGGAEAMIRDGLFERFPIEAIYGLHNMPGVPNGVIGARAGPILAGFDVFDVIVRATGGHAAMPRAGDDALLAACAFGGSLSMISGHDTPRTEPVLVALTKIQGGQTYNVSPDTVVMSGCARVFSDAMAELVETRMKELADGLAAAHRVAIEVRYRRGYPPLIATPAESANAQRAAIAAVGEGRVLHAFDAMMGSEDFAFYLREKPGAFAVLGAGAAPDEALLHGPRYDFNDAVLPHGVAYWANLAAIVCPEG